MLEWVRNTLRNFAQNHHVDWAPAQLERFKRNCLQAIVLLTSFYILMALPIVGPTLQFILGASLTPGQSTVLGLLGSYLRHLSAIGLQAAITWFFNPANIPEFGASFYQQVFGFIGGLLAGSFARQIAFLVQPVTTILGFYFGSQSVAIAATTLCMAGLAALPVVLAIQHNGKIDAQRQRNPVGVDDDGLGRFSVTQMLVMSYSSFIGSCFPQFSFGFPVISNAWSRIAYCTGAANVRQLAGQDAINAAYNHFIGFSAPIGTLTETATAVLFTKEQPVPQRVNMAANVRQAFRS